ncbi:molecular chaperone, partial [Pseudomonas sp. MWU13-2860]
TLSGDTCIPTPDYAIYPDQAQELDGLTQRINALVKAVKLVGVYDGIAVGVERLLSEGVENRLVPVKYWPAFAEKGGLAGSVQFLPLEQVAAALMQLYEAREKVKQEMYEITGMSDILRGANDPSETATATRAKGAFASIRLRDMQ